MGPCPLRRYALKVTCPGRKSTLPDCTGQGSFLVLPSSPYSFSVLEDWCAVLMFCSMETGVNVNQYFPLLFHSFF